MYSHLDPIFRTQLRLAETLDTRQGLRRNKETEERGRRDQRQERPDDDDLWQDRTAVSTAALKQFLEQLARQQEQAAGTSDKDVQEDVQPPAPIKTEEPQHGDSATAPGAARAAQAYQRTYRATHQDEAPPLNSDAVPTLQLSPEELRVISRLVRDIDTLIRAGITDLRIDKSENFLQSLVEAVAREKAAL